MGSIFVVDVSIQRMNQWFVSCDLSLNREFGGATGRRSSRGLAWSWRVEKWRLWVAHKRGGVWRRAVVSGKSERRVEFAVR